MFFSSKIFTGTNATTVTPEHATGTDASLRKTSEEPVVVQTEQPEIQEKYGQEKKKDDLITAAIVPASTYHILSNTYFPLMYLGRPLPPYLFYNYLHYHPQASIVKPLNVIG